jgi:cytochrome b subunit of formate dehydrogenase
MLKTKQRKPRPASPKPPRAASPTPAPVDPATAPGAAAAATLTRFDVFQRLQHIILIVAFTTLALTGLPQLFARAGWAQGLMWLLGGIAGVRRIHHLAGTILIFEFGYHVIVALGDLVVRRSRSMVPRLQDVRDAAHAVAFLLGRRANPPRYDRFDWKQKLEYWSLMWGTVAMAVTGLVLMFPAVVTRWLPGVVVYAAKAAHGLEALLAVASIITWHMYNTHLAEGLFPLDRTIFTGTITRERLVHEHPLEYERLLAAAAAPAPEREAVPAPAAPDLSVTEAALAESEGQ